MFTIPEWVQQFGFPAVVCVMLIYIVHMMIERHAKERAEQSALDRAFAEALVKRHDNSANTMAQRHSDERTAWFTMSSADRQTMTDAVRSLETAMLRNYQGK